MADKSKSPGKEINQQSPSTHHPAIVLKLGGPPSTSTTATTEKKEQLKAAEVADPTPLSAGDNNADSTAAAQDNTSAKQPERNKNEESRMDQLNRQSYASQSEEESADTENDASMDAASEPELAGKSSPRQQGAAISSPPPVAPQASPSMPSTITLVAASNATTRPASVGGTPRLAPAAQAQLHAQIQAQQQGQAQQSGMQLTDAFAYLDRVRFEFADQPEVYNRFLQVMREFKANSIDANGVIARVVHLFKGHRALILGFNAFLPKTHHIDPNLTDFTHLMYPRPSGAPSSVSRSSPYAAPPPSLPSPSPGWMADMQQQPSMPRLAPNPQPPTLQHPSSFHQQYHHYYPQSPNAPPGPPSSHLLPRPPASTPLHHGAPPQLPPGMSFPPPPSAQPAFPSIAPLAAGTLPPGFPLMSPVSASSGAAVASTTTAGIIYTGSAAAVASNFSHIPSPAPMSASAASRRQLPLATSTGANQSMVAANNAQPNTQFSRAVAFVKKIKHRYANDSETYRTFLNCLHAFHRDQRSVPDVCRQVGGLFRDAPDLMDEFLQFLPSSTSLSSDAGAANLVGAASTSSRPRKRTRSAEAAAIVRTQEETAFFERVRHHLGSRAVYAEFLKCLALYSQDILRLRDLLQIIDGFIGGAPELLAWFRRYLGVETSGQCAASPERMSAAAASSGELNLSTCKRAGSYRLLPATYHMVPASGRTPLCAEVLNDTMVSTASFESEDAGFVSSKKNVYEEALFRCEDERFEMDLLLEHNLATIAVLEPIARKFAAMEEQQRASLRLDASLGGSSHTIYRRAIRRIYGPERGDDFYRALQERPSIAVPVVLARLRQKDAEWRRVQRDWARVWRDVHARNYHRSLDHHGIDFKTADRRTFSVRAFVAEIEQLRSATRKRSVSGSTASVLPQLPSPVAMLRLTATDSACLRDVQELLLVAVRSAFIPCSGQDRHHLAHLFATLPSDLFGLPSMSEPVDSQNEDNTSGENEDDRRTTRRALQPIVDVSPKTAAALVNVGTSTPAANPQVIYANNAVYALVRILHLAADRVTRMCAVAAAANGQAHFTEKASVVAGFLGLNAFSADKSSNNAAIINDFYGVLKELLAKLLSGTAQGDEFEEQARFMFGTAAYPIYTFDRLAAAAIRQAQACLADPAALLLQQYMAWRAKQGSSEYSYRLAAESIVAPRDNLYRIECYRDGSLAIQLLDRLTSTAAAVTSNAGMEGGSPSTMMSVPVTSIEERWSAYVDDFVRMDPIARYIRCLPFLRRCMQNTRCPVIDYRLECKICVNTYRLFFLEHTEDFLLNPRHAAARTVGKKRARRFAEWLEARP